jgi:hypothetical protein
MEMADLGDPELTTAERFKGQKLSACRPFMSPLLATFVYGSFTVTSILLGFVFQAASANIHEITIPYDSTSSKINQSFTVPFTVPADMTGPVYIYYELSNIYQKVFIYSRSISWNQLLGRPSTDTELKDACAPKVNTSNPFDLVPCGAIAGSVFNDSFHFSDFPTLSFTGIATRQFHELFAQPDAMYTSERKLLDDHLFPGGQQDEHFVNWVELATWGKFRKLWAKTATDATIEAGNYSVTINNRFDVSSFGGTKAIVISKVSWIGGKNPFFGILFLVIAGASFIAAIVFLVVWIFRLMPLYQTSLQEDRGELKKTLVD